MIEFMHCTCGRPVSVVKLHLKVPEGPWVPIGELTRCCICNKKYGLKPLRNEHGVTLGMVEKALAAYPMHEFFTIMELKDPKPEKYYNPNEYLGEREE